MSFSIWRSASMLRLTVSGEVAATLFASTTGSDADWVVKLIDLYPDEVPGRQEMGGYQLMIAGDILRGRFRESFSEARPIPPDEVLPYRVPMPHVNHTFLPGHRMLVQVQSTWFPLYDRNPQTFVEDVWRAAPEEPEEGLVRGFVLSVYGERFSIVCNSVPLSSDMHLGDLTHLEHDLSSFGAERLELKLDLHAMEQLLPAAGISVDPAQGPKRFFVLRSELEHSLEMSDGAVLVVEMLFADFRSSTSKRHLELVVALEGDLPLEHLELTFVVSRAIRCALGRLDRAEVLG